MINSRDDILDVLEDYLATEYERVFDLFSDFEKWSDHKQALYNNGVVLGKFREKDLDTMNTLKRGVSDKALLNEIRININYEISLYKAKDELDILDRTHIAINEKMSKELLIYSIDEWIDRNCGWIKEDIVDISYQEERVLLYLYYAFQNFSNQRKHPYYNELNLVEGVYSNILDKQSQFYKYGLLSIDEDRQLLAVNPPRIYDRLVDKTFFTKNVPLHLLQQITQMMSDGLIGEFAVRPLNESGYEGRLDLEYIPEALERGKLFDLVDLGNYQVSKLYSEIYEDCMWVAIDPENITFEELCDDFDTYEDMIVTQVIHLQYECSEKSCYITHMDHEYIFYNIDEYEKRMKDVHQKGTARTRMKSFKIDNARIPFDTKIKILRKDENGIDCPPMYEQFLCYVLETYFKHKELLEEYFQNCE